MKKFYALVLIALLSAATAPARQWTKDNVRLKSNQRGTVVKAPAAKVVVNEDFSLFAAGSEQAPDSKSISDENNTVPDTYTAQPGWVGGGVFAAGGTCFLGNYVNYYGENGFGFVSTPLMELFGTVELSFRARAFADDKSSLWLAFCDDYYGPADDIDIELGPEWKEYTFTTTKGSFIDPCNFQFQAENGRVLLDDICIKRTIDRIPAPNALPAVNKSLTEFEARWEETSAPEHLLSVYYKEVPADPRSETVKENFDGIKAGTNGKIDTTAPNYPEGWTIELSNQGNTEITREQGCFNSAPQALVLDAQGDRIVTAPMPLPVKTFHFWIRPSKIDQYSNSLIGIKLYGENGKYDHIANIPCYWLNEEGGWYEFTDEQIGDGFNRVEIVFESKDDDINFYIDDLTIECEEQPSDKYIVKDFAVSGGSYTVSDIDPEKDYYYSLRARDGETLSDTSYPVWVDGLVGLKPAAAQATDVTSTSFTASWERMPHADSYIVSLFRTVKATADMPGVVVISENFDKIEEGTPDAPGTDWSNVNLAERGMANSAWTLVNPAWANGMAGSNGTTWYGSAGLVASPRLSLGNNGGTFAVEADVYSTVDNDEIFVMILNEITDTQAQDARAIACPRKGINHGTAVFEGTGRDNIIIAFMSKSGARFFVDDVTINQDLRAGETLVTPAVSSETTTECSITFSGLPDNLDHCYNVVAKRNKDFEVYASETSDIVVVNNSTTGIGNVAIDSQATVTVVNPQGMTLLRNAPRAALGTLPRGLYIVNGTKTAIK